MALTNQQKYENWLKKAKDKPTLELLQSMKSDSKAIDNAFYKELEFGTGGLRGELGAGTNCLNVYTIAKVTQGIADNMKANGFSTVAISMDSRINSDIFCVKAAEVFAANDIKAFVTKECMPTPFLSFMVRELKTDIGVMITASHNPSQYNGYKVYGSDGCQLTDNRANDMIACINKVDPFEVVTKSLDFYQNKGLIEVVSDELEVQYLSAVKAQSVGDAKGIKVVYTPLNGAGYRLVPEILREVGVEDLYIVTEQSKPDGRFLTCSYPNPEKTEALKLGLELLQKSNADLLIATDPDADRMGLAVKARKGYRLLSGNETGVLLTDYLFSRRKALGTMPQKPILCKTIVSSELAIKVADEYGAESFDVLTGFKYIGEVILGLENRGEEDRFVFGFEESYGCLAGTYVRDKDAVVASMLAAEMAAYYKKLGKSLADRIEEIYAKFGTYQHKLLSKEFSGAMGNAKMKQLLKDLREKNPTEMGGIKIIKSIDYLIQSEVDLPPSNVLSYNLEGGAQLIIRPSGTEPLIKFYLTAAKTPNENAVIFEKLEEFIEECFV